MTVQGVIEFEIYLLGLIAPELMFMHKYPRRNFFALKLVIGITVCAIAAFGSYMLVPVLRQINPKYAATIILLVYNFVLAVMTFALMYIAFKCDVSDVLFHGINAMALQHCGFALFSIFSLLCSQAGQTVACDGPLYWLVLVGSYSFVYLLAYFAFYKKIQDDPTHISRRRLVIPMLCIIVIVYVLSTLTGVVSPTNGGDILYKVYSIVACILLFCISLGIFETGKLKSDLEIVKHLQKQMHDQYRISKENIDSINIKFHDIRHRIDNLRKIGGDKAADKILDDLYANISLYDSISKTGNEYVDVVLTEKAMYCEKVGIKLTFIIDGSALAFLDESDTYSLLSNVLDNAIDAVMGISDTSKRVISMTVKTLEEIVYLIAQNYYEGTLLYKDNKLVTKNPDKAMHGYGMKSIRNITEKYNGILQIKTVDNLFILKILFPHSPSNAS